MQVIWDTMTLMWLEALLTSKPRLKDANLLHHIFFEFEYDARTFYMLKGKHSQAWYFSHLHVVILTFNYMCFAMLSENEMNALPA